MKIERINDPQIRCTLSNFDLSERNLNLSELAYGTEKARRLFQEMVQKAYDEVGFDAEDIPLMVEAIPLSNESIMLVITKVDDPEEVDTRFSKFAPAPEGDFPELRGEPADPGLEGGEVFTALRDADTETPRRPRTHGKHLRYSLQKPGGRKLLPGPDRQLRQRGGIFRSVQPAFGIRKPCERDLLQLILL